MSYDPRFAPPATLSVAEILAATGGKLVGGLGEVAVCTDSRAAAPGKLFVALKGDVHDAHRFVPDALAAGAGAIVSRIDRAWPAPQGPLVHVPDTLDALGSLGRAVLLRDGPSVAAVTGSVGKTSTRAMLSAILEQAFPTLSTDGNFNNRIGLPLTLLQLKPEHRTARPGLDRKTATRR